MTLTDKSVSLNLGTIAVVVLALLLVGGIYLHSMRAYERMLGKAEEREAAYIQKMDALAAKWEVDRERLAEAEKQQGQVRERIVYRDREAEKKIAEVTAPDRPTEQIVDDVLQTYGFAARLDVPNLISFTPPQVQTFVATKIDRDRLELNFKDKQFELDFEREKVRILSEDFSEARRQLTDAESVIEGYKRVAVKSKWRKFFDAAKKVGIFAGGVLVGRALTR